MTNEEANELLTTAEVATLIGRDVRQVQRRAAIRNVHGLRFGRFRYWTPLDVAVISPDPPSHGRLPRNL